MLLVDLLLIAIVGIFALMGLRSGIIHESATLAGLAVGLLVAGRYNDRASALLLPWLHSPTIASLGAFVLILFAIWILVLVIGSIMRGILEGISLGWLDNLGGAVFGALKGLLVAQILILIAMALPIKSLQASIMDSWLAGSLARLAPDIVALIPPVLRYWKPF